MKIEQLQQLLQIVAEGSMNEAAQKLYVARSSLSTSMKNLEAELGAPIFERTTRGVTLTALVVMYTSRLRRSVSGFLFCKVCLKQGGARICLSPAYIVLLRTMPL